LTQADNGIIGIGMDRPALNRLKTDIAAGKVKAVIFRDTNRIGRKMYEVSAWITDAMHLGVSFTSVHDGMTDDSFEKYEVSLQRFLEYI